MWLQTRLWLGGTTLINPRYLRTLAITPIVSWIRFGLSLLSGRMSHLFKALKLCHACSNLIEHKVFPPWNIGNEIGGRFHIFRQAQTATCTTWSIRRCLGNKDITSGSKKVLKRKQKSPTSLDWFRAVMNYGFQTAIWDHIAENGLQLTTSDFMSPSQEGQGTSEVVRVQPTPGVYSLPFFPSSSGRVHPCKGEAPDTRTMTRLFQDLIHKCWHC